MNLVVRADANANIGTGHVMRCLALAQAWKARVGQVTFVSACESDALCQRLEDEGLQLVILERSYPDPTDMEVTSRILKKQSAAWLVLDGYGFDSEYQYQIKRNGHRLLVIDDAAPSDHYYADVILNQNINAEELSYSCEPRSRLLLGTQYGLLRSEFLAWKGWERKISKTASKLLVTLGGGDSGNQTLKVLRALDLIDTEGIEARIVLGTCNTTFKTAESPCSDPRKAYSFFRNVRNMPELMAWADIAVSAAGSTSWELTYMGVPFLTTILAQNQARIAEGLGQAGAAINLGWSRDLHEEELAQHLSDLIPRWEVRQRLSNMGQRLVDGLGAQRVISCLVER